MATKARFFTFIVYPDSAPTDWLRQLEASLRMFLVSPLHEPDKVAEDVPDDAAIGHQRKPHWHVCYCHGNTITARAARSLIRDEFPWALMPPQDNKFMVGAACNLARYFLHIDQPDKQQFEGDPYELLTALNGYPLDLSRQLTRAEKRQMRVNVQAFAGQHGIVEYAELCDSLRHVQDWEMYDFVCDNYGWCNAYLRSKAGAARWQAGQDGSTDESAGGAS